MVIRADIDRLAPSRAQARQLGLQDAARENRFRQGLIQQGGKDLNQIADFMDRRDILNQLSSQQEQLGVQPVQQPQQVDVEAQTDAILESGGIVDEETEANFSSLAEKTEGASDADMQKEIINHAQKGLAEGRDMSDTIELAGKSPQEQRLAIGNINEMIKNKSVRRMMARNPEGAASFLKGLGVTGVDGSGGKDFADKAVFTSREKEDGSIEQGFAVYDPDSKKTTFEPIEGKGLKETPKDKRQRELDAKKELERFKTDQSLIREMNSQTLTPQGKLNLAKSKVESEQLRANKLAKNTRAVNAVGMLERLDNMDLEKIYGRGESIYPELMRSQEGIDAIADRSQLISILKIMGRGELKGQGTVSDFEAKMLGDAATILGNPDISADAARREINRIKQTFVDLSNGINYENGSPAQGSKPKAQTNTNSASASDKLKAAKAKAGY